MPFKKSKSKEDLTSGELSKEFFGDGSTVTPGQDTSKDDGTTNLFHAIVGDKGNDQKENYSLFSESKSQRDLGPDYGKRSWFQLGGKDDPTVNPYAAEQDKRYSMDPRSKKIIKLVILTVVCFIVFGVILPSASYNIHYAYTFSAFITCIQDNFSALTGTFNGDSYIPYKLCTYGIILFAGAGLAVTGAVYQGALKNALVSPTTLGINSGATLGVALFVLFASVDILSPVAGNQSISAIDAQSVIDYYNSLSFSEYLLVTQGRAFCSILGSFVAVALVLLVSFLVGRGRSSSFALIICGQVIAAVATSAVEVIRYYVVETDTTSIKSSLIQSAQIGAINSYSTPLDLLLVAVPVTVGVILVILLRRRMNLLAFNDEEARSMGISTEKLRWVMVFLCTLITAVIVAFCGNVAFIGFAVPLIVRRYIGPDFNYLVPASAFMGALYLTVTYWASDLDIFGFFGISFPSSVSLLTSTIGIVLFAVTTIKQRRQMRSADWL